MMTLMGEISRAAQPKNARIEFRLSDAQRDLIARGAEASNKTLSEFVIEHVTLAAEMAILDRRIITLDPEAFAQFEEILDRPARVNEGLKDLFSRGAAWSETKA
jgi:hypothetical protein